MSGTIQILRVQPAAGLGKIGACPQGFPLKPPTMAPAALFCPIVFLVRQERRAISFLVQINETTCPGHLGALRGGPQVCCHHQFWGQTVRLVMLDRLVPESCPSYRSPSTLTA